jgi:alkylation response protein AidB-like acyl-CoA dehydrogenase
MEEADLDFSLTDEQRLLQDQIDSALAGISPLARVRSQAEQPNQLAEDVWRGLRDLGILGVLVPEAFGGLGLGALDAALIGEVLGKHVVPSPFLGPVVLAPLALTFAGTDRQKNELLPRIVDGTLRIAVGISEQTAGVRTGAGVESRNGKLFGRSLFVVDHVGAHQFLVADKRGDFYLLDRDTPALEIVTLDTVDRTRSTAMLIFNGAIAEPLAGTRGDASQRLANASHLVLAADLMGAAGKMLDQAVAYAKVREQFGRPIGSFQAVKHMCAEMAAELEPGRALIWYAGYALDEDLSDATLCCLHAKSYLAEAARFVARTATEVHGGMGITDDLGLHFWFKRIGWSYQAFGSPVKLREQAAAIQDVRKRQQLRCSPLDNAIG